MTTAARVHARIVFLALVLFALAGAASAQTRPGLIFDFAAAGFDAGTFMNCAPILEMNGGFRTCDVNPYPDFDFDGNRNTIELTEARLSASGLPEYELRVTSVGTSPTIRFCHGAWFMPIEKISAALQASGITEWLVRWDIYTVGGRHVIWFRTASKFGFLYVDVPTC